MLVCAVILTVFGWDMWSARKFRLSIAETESSTLARSLADHVEATVHVADIALVGVVEQLEIGGGSPAQAARIQGALNENLARWGRLQSLTIFDMKGNRLAGTGARRPPSAPPWDAIAFHNTHPYWRPRVGPPIENWVEPGWSLLVSRRFNARDGTAAGVAVATIDLGYFSSFYKTFDVGSSGSIMLTDEDGIGLARAAGTRDFTGRDLSKTAMFRTYLEVGPIGTATITSPIDAVERITSFRHTAEYPLLIHVGFSRDDLLLGWWREVWRDGCVVAVMLACVCLLGWRLSRRMDEQQRAEAEARASEQLYRLLAVNTTDVIVKLSPDHRRLYVSPACRDVLGYEPSEMLDHSPQDRVHPEDWPAVAAALQPATLASIRRVTYRFARADGVYVWLEASVRSLDDGSGYVSAVRDITSRVETEQKLSVANARLQSQVMLDSLTGIANRRCFDLLLDREFEVCSRRATPLSLLMIDVDHFKAFNDRFGHQAGDECLRQIGATLAEQLRRPADVAARYGGEEFALLLPDTDRQGALLIAENVRSAVRALHQSNPDSMIGTLTVSIGLISAIPGAAVDGTGMLVSLADRALYQAKASGRDQVNVASTDLTETAGLPPTPARIPQSADAEA